MEYATTPSSSMEETSREDINKKQKDQGGGKFGKVTILDYDICCYVLNYINVENENWPHKHPEVNSYERNDLERTC